MKNSIVLGVVTLAALVCAAAPAPRPPATGEKPLFLHLIDPGVYTDPPGPSHRIVTARIYPFQDFSVAVGDSENPFAKPWDGAATSPIWKADGAPVPRPLQSLWDSGDATLAGRIDVVEGKFVAHLQGRNRTTLNYFHGPIELEKPVYEHGSYFHGGSVWQVWFALSTNADCAPFLKALHDGTLKRPDIVERGSPLAERWEHNQPSPKPAPPSSTPAH